MPLATTSTGVAVVFGCNGFAVASWFARIPAARDGLDLPAGRLGVLLLALSAGAVLALCSGAAVTHRLGPARTVRSGATVVATGLVAIGVSVEARATPAVAVGLFVLGCGSGICQVAMNVEAATVEQRLGRNVMSRFHAAWSLGTLAAAAGAAAAAHRGLPVAVHLPLVAAAVLGGTLRATGAFLPAPPLPGSPRPKPSGSGASDPPPSDPPPSGSGASAAWREPRTLLVGVLVLVAAFAEGVANDWLAVAFVTGRGFSESAGAAVFGVFVAAMTTGRIAGTVALDRWGRVPVLAATLLLAAAGAATTALGGPAALAVTGVALWGLGTSLGFPIGMSAAADDPGRAAARVSVVAVMGYTAFLGGPPLIGILAGRTGILPALLTVPLMLVPALSLLPAVRPPKSRDPF